MDKTALSTVRVILLHKHGTSARTRFLRYREGTVLAFAPLPKLSALYDETLPPPDPAVVEYHPAMVLKQLAQYLDLAVESLQLEPEYHALVDTPQGPVRVLLVAVTTIDPPFAQAEAIDARFVDLTQARDLPPVELLLLRRAYEAVMEG